MGVVVSLVPFLVWSVNGEVHHYFVPIAQHGGKILYQGDVLFLVEFSWQRHLVFSCGAGVLAIFPGFSCIPELLSVYGLAVWCNDACVLDAMSFAVVVGEAMKFVLELAACTVSYRRDGGSAF